jgi:hypothetical protein
MISIISILLLFIIPANIILLVLFGIKKTRSEKKVNFLISHGTAPLFNGLILYYLIWLFPQRSDLFYLSLISIFWVVLFLLFIRRYQNFLVFYKRAYFVLRNNVFKRCALFFLPGFIFLCLFAIQALFYPIAENDSAYYFHQATAFSKTKEINWGSANINGDEYSQNPMIRPGLVSTYSFYFLLNENNNWRFVSFKFISVYYYLLLLAIFLILVLRLSKNKTNKFYNILFSFYFFTFFWSLTRFFVYNNKEPIIFFLALCSLYVFHKIINLNKRNIFLEMFLSSLIGLNMFINLHGVIIGLIILFLLLVFSKLSLSKRIIQTSFIFILSFPFGAFEFLVKFKFIFAGLIDFLNQKIILFKQYWLEKIGKSFENNDIYKYNQDNNIIENHDIQSLEKVGEDHENMYQFKNIFDEYIKGKFQIFFNIGVFGFYSWLFLLLSISMFRSMLNSKLSKILIIFLLAYFIIIIDPLRLNNHPLAVVLSGDIKYGMFIVLVMLLFIGTNFQKVVDFIFKIFVDYGKIISSFLFLLISFIILFRKKILTIGTEILIKSIKNVWNYDFYYQKIELFYLIIVLISFLLFAISVGIVFFKRKQNTWYKFLVVVLILGVVSPFFVVSAGKVAWQNTFLYLAGKDKNLDVIEEIQYQEDLYKVYSYAEDNFPKDSLLITDFIQLYIYDEHFHLTRNKNKKEAIYRITKKCSLDEKKIFNSGEFVLCSK